MTYKDRFVAEVKCGGKILRVNNDTVTLPFGSEYSLLFKNLNSRKARVDVSIDGQDVLDGKSLILNPNETVELEGFMRGMQGRNKFRFIQKTKEISEHRGDRIDDGLIRVEFAYEEEPPPRMVSIIHDHHHHHHNYYNNWPIYRRFSDNYAGSELRSKTVTYGSSDEPIQANFSNNASLNLDSENMSRVVSQVQTPIDDVGITVKGSEINQQFDYGHIGNTDPSEVIIIRLRGTTNRGVVAEEPVTVKTKLTCSSCGRKWSSNIKFCGNCGTYL